MGHHVVVADIRDPEHFDLREICDEFRKVDLKYVENCQSVVRGCERVFNMAALMGGMGCIQSNNAVILYTNTMISFNMVEACRREKVDKYFFASSACIYPEHAQKDYENVGLKESDAWPADPQDSYGLEKLVTEELCLDYMKDFGMQVRIGRFHNIYGPFGTWKGGKEKAPAAFARKALVSEEDLEVWGSGNQTRSFCYIDDCVEAVLRLMESDYHLPLNIGSTEMISIDSLAALALQFAGKDIPLRHVEGPIGVNGRNSDNTLIRQVLGWEPSIPIRRGLIETMKWIESRLPPCPEERRALSSSHVVTLDPDVYCK